MDAGKKKCMVCGKLTTVTGGICEPCQDHIRREAMREQAGLRDDADKELKKEGITPDKRST
jgi:hypothetical protein